QRAPLRPPDLAVEGQHVLALEPLETAGGLHRLHATPERAARGPGAQQQGVGPAQHQRVLRAAADVLQRLEGQRGPLRQVGHQVDGVVALVGQGLECDLRRERVQLQGQGQPQQIARVGDVGRVHGLAVPLRALREHRQRHLRQAFLARGVTHPAPVADQPDRGARHAGPGQQQDAQAIGQLGLLERQRGHRRRGRRFGRTLEAVLRERRHRRRPRGQHAAEHQLTPVQPRQTQAALGGARPAPRRRRATTRRPMWRRKPHPE
ncbi:conserved hypothetical protein, partial [Ricinus communis]